MTVRVDVKIGQTVVRQAMNGHAFEYTIVGFYPDGAIRTGSSWNAPHADSCGCRSADAEDWEPIPDW
jgi:hypothetical protein